MKKSLLLLICGFLFTHQFTKAQGDSVNVDSLMAIYVESYENGVLRIKPNLLTPGELFTTYKSFFLEGEAHQMVLLKQWTDNVVGMDHYKYQQEYHGLRVEGAQFIEHIEPDGYTRFAKGKISELDADFPNITHSTESAALNTLLSALDFENAFDWAWEDLEWEQELKDDLGDPLATYYPLGQGELLWALENTTKLGANIDKNKYHLAWYFEVLCLDPNFHMGYYVDAITGEVFKEESLRHYDGTANTFTYGNKTIDTKYRGFPYGNYLLEANTDGRNFETRYYDNDKGWGRLNKITDGDDFWETNNQEGTTGHYHVQKSWDYFKDVHGREGFDDDGVEIRVQVDMDNDGTRWDQVGKRDYIFIGEESDGTSHTRALDMVGHEFTHGVIKRIAGLPYRNEHGALNESFSDIFGTLIQYHEEGTIDWELFEDIGLTNPRNMANPNSGGIHIYDGNCNVTLGQPDTYEGTYWYSGYACDYGGVHVNSGVQNHWFYLFVNGGTGVNDHNDGYAVSGVGIDRAEELVYFALDNLIVEGDEYVDAREATMLAAEMLRWKCSNLYRQVTNAWFAVGVGAEAQCPTGSSHQPYHTPEWSVYPNPASSKIQIHSDEEMLQSIVLYNTAGIEVMQTTNLSAAQHTFQIDHLPKGQYILQLHGSKSVQTRKLLIQ